MMTELEIMQRAKQYTVYDQSAQQFIFDNMEAIIAFIRESEAAK